MKKLMLAALLIATPVFAQTVIVVRPTPDYSYLNSAGKQAAENAGQQLGAMLGSALQAKRPTVIVIEIKCDKYVRIVLGYADGTIKPVPMNDAPVDRTELATAQAAIPMLRVVDGGC
ncbi:MAG: hypothetical protein ACLPSY_09175 [Steroidobacteraceae bacterium]